jgi:hypothetical protein
MGCRIPDRARDSLAEMRFPAIRAVFALILISSWLALLFSGLAFRGAVHVFLIAALVLFPWRAALGPPPPEGEEGESTTQE